MNKKISAIVLVSYVFSSTSVFSAGTGEKPPWEKGNEVKTSVDNNGTATVQLKDDNCPFFGVSNSDDQKDKNLAIIQNSVLAAYTDDQSCGDIKKAVDNIPKAPDINKGPSGPSGAPDPGGRQVACDQNYQQTWRISQSGLQSS
jgi:hypothetical protein